MKAPATAAPATPQPAGREAAPAPQADHRPAAVAQRQLQTALDASPRQVAQRQQAAATQPRPNRTGLPDQLKAGVENLSGYSLDDVKVHYNSAKPAQLQAHAYAQGTDIHVAPGQEKHLPHEAWHVVQQKQGRVRATRQLKGGLPLNDDFSLEQEADRMGNAALRNTNSLSPERGHPIQYRKAVQRVVKINNKVESVDLLWSGVQQLVQAELAPEEVSKAKIILNTWVSAPSESAIPLRTSENRNYNTYGDLAKGLIGEVQTAEMKIAEESEAKKILDSKDITVLVNKAMKKIKATYSNIPNTVGRYSFHYSEMHKLTISLARAVNQWNESQSLAKTIALILDVSLAVRDEASRILQRKGQRTDILSPKQNDARQTHWNPNEGADWTAYARRNRLPLSAGPSATTGQAMRVLRGAIVTSEEMEAVAMAAHAFWIHKSFRHKSGIHTRHEVRSVLNFHLALLIPDAPPLPPPGYVSTQPNAKWEKVDGKWIPTAPPPPVKKTGGGLN